MANRSRAGWRQKAWEEGSPSTCFTFHGARKANSSISRSDATALHSRQTHAARARSAGSRCSRIARRRSRETRAEKLEFIGESTSSEEEPAAVEISRLSGLGLGIGETRFLMRSSSSSPQHPMVGDKGKAASERGTIENFGIRLILWW